jgi:hypothetical protein
VSRIGARHSAVGGAAAGGPRRRWRAAQALAVIAAAGLVAAGCGGSDEGGGGGGSEASADSDPAVAYAECMRENGVPEFPDPVNGQLQLQAGSGLDPDSPEFKRAQEACQDLAPAGAEAGGGPDADLQAQVLDYAKCIRENGVPEFPDPDFSGGGVVMQLPPGVDENSEQFQSAQQACQDKAPQGLGGGQ